MPRILIIGERNFKFTPEGGNGEISIHDFTFIDPQDCIAEAQGMGCKAGKMSLNAAPPECRRALSQVPGIYDIEVGITQKGGQSVAVPRALRFVAAFDFAQIFAACEQHAAKAGG